MAVPFNYREAMFNARLQYAMRRLRARRMPLVTINVNFPTTPTAAPDTPRRPRLERQNAAEVRNAFNFLQLLLDDQESEDEGQAPPKVNLWRYDLLPAHTPEEWECSVCLDSGKEETKIHPSNCHVFHEQCLQGWMASNISCPLCRSITTPLLMTMFDTSL